MWDGFVKCDQNRAWRLTKTLLLLYTFISSLPGIHIILPTNKHQLLWSWSFVPPHPGQDDSGPTHIMKSWCMLRIFVLICVPSLRPHFIVHSRSIHFWQRSGCYIWTYSTKLWYDSYLVIYGEGCISKRVKRHHFVPYKKCRFYMNENHSFSMNVWATRVGEGRAEKEFADVLFFLRYAI